MVIQRPLLADLNVERVVNLLSRSQILGLLVVFCQLFRLLTLISPYLFIPFSVQVCTNFLELLQEKNVEEEKSEKKEIGPFTTRQPQSPRIICNSTVHTILQKLFLGADVFRKHFQVPRTLDRLIHRSQYSMRK